MPNIAVLMTCFNRKQLTIKCLHHLFLLNPQADVYLVDDMSTDGTFNDISCLFPKVNLILGTGNLFWSRGMHLAWQHASKDYYDFYLWLNDDIVLYENSLIELFECSKFSNDNSIICGIIESTEGHVAIYGGTDVNKNLLQPNGGMQHITNMNGNVVLIPKSVYKILRNIDPIFHHDLGDVDYGLRAAKNNINLVTTRVSIASGVSNNFCRVRKRGVNMNERFKFLYAPLGSNPGINFYFRKKHYGLLNAVIYYLYIHYINFLPDGMIYRIFGDRYR